MVGRKFSFPVSRATLRDPMSRDTLSDWGLSGNGRVTFRKKFKGRGGVSTTRTDILMQPKIRRKG